MDYLYIAIYLLSMPIFWQILCALHIEKYFEAGKVKAIRAAYALITLILCHLLAISLSSISEAVLNLF